MTPINWLSVISNVSAIRSMFLRAMAAVDPLQAAARAGNRDWFYPRFSNPEIQLQRILVW
tara:strand:- start:447 stop:626 length:180 start_codon:yes stop_codon:yes gene_type:complete